MAASEAESPRGCPVSSKRAAPGGAAWNMSRHRASRAKRWGTMGFIDLFRRHSLYAYCVDIFGELIEHDHVTCSCLGQRKEPQHSSSTSIAEDPFSSHGDVT